MLRIILQCLMYIIIGPMALFIIFMGYSLYAEPKAERLAKEFCASVKIGDDPAAVLTQAKASNAIMQLTWRGKPTEEKTLLVVFMGTPPFLRHICKINAMNKITKIEYYYSD